MIFYILTVLVLIICYIFYRENKIQHQLHLSIIDELRVEIDLQNKISNAFQSNYSSKIIDGLHNKLEIIKKQVALLTIISNE